MIRGLLTWILLGSLLALGQNTTEVVPSCELANNTSASPRYRGNRANTAPLNVSKLPVRSLLYEGATTRIFVRFMPWFGDPKHHDVGYRSDNREQVSRQLADMLSRGIRGAIVDWYGPNSGAKNESTLLLMREAERQGLEFAVSEDAGALGDCEKRGCNVTDQLIADLTYAAEHFESSPAYIRFDGRPALFFFGPEKYSIDWNRVRRSVPMRPLFFFRNSGAFTDPRADGAYSWIAPETVIPTDPMAVQYLERFYSKARQSEKIAIGSAYKGFDDEEASWGKGRVIDQKCGQTWLSTFAVANRFYSAKHQLPALIIPTWNDYEEGTEIETGIDNCVDVKAAVHDKVLTWTLSGSENAVERFVILAEAGSQWREVTTLPQDQRSAALRDFQLSPNTKNLCVLAIGRPSMRNHSSGPIQLSPDEPPKNGRTP